MHRVKAIGGRRHRASRRNRHVPVLLNSVLVLFLINGPREEMKGKAEARLSRLSVKLSYLVLRIRANEIFEADISFKKLFTR